MQTYLALYLRRHQYVGSVSHSSRRVISASGWIEASVLVQLLLLQLHTNLLQQLEEKGESERAGNLQWTALKSHI